MHSALHLPRSARRPVPGVSRRQALGLSGIGLGALALSACGGSGGGGGEAPSGDSGEDFHLTSFALSEDPPSSWIEETLAGYEEEHGLTVTTTADAYNDALNQILLRARGGELNGVVQLNLEWLAPMVATGKLVDLAEYASGIDYTEAALATGQLEGTQYGLPWTTAAIGLIANTELLEQAGVGETPVTLDEFADALRAVKELGGDIVPYAASTEVAQLKDFIFWLETHGATLMEDGSSTLGDDASVAAMEWYKGLYDEGLIAAGTDRNSARNLFSQGRTAFYDDAPIGASIVVANSPDAEIQSKMAPTARPVLAAGDTPRALAWGNLLVVVDGPGAVSGAEFAQWITSDPEIALEYFGVTSSPPVTETGLEGEEIQEDPFLSAFTEKITATASTSPLWAYPEYAQLETALAEAVQAALLGQQSPAEAMAAAGEEINSLL